MAIHNVRTEIGISSTPEELEVSAGEMGIPVEHLKKMLIYLEKMRVEAERLNLAPSIACNAAVTFISNAIKHNYEEGGGLTFTMTAPRPSCTTWTPPSPIPANLTRKRSQTCIKFCR